MNPLTYRYNELTTLLSKLDIQFSIGETCRHRTPVLSISEKGTNFNEIRFYVRDFVLDEQGNLKQLSIKYFYDSKERLNEDVVGVLNFETLVVDKQTSSSMSFKDFIKQYNLQ